MGENIPCILLSIFGTIWLVHKMSMSPSSMLRWQWYWWQLAILPTIGDMVWMWCWKRPQVILMWNAWQLSSCLKQIAIKTTNGLARCLWRKQNWLTYWPMSNTEVIASKMQSHHVWIRGCGMMLSTWDGNLQLSAQMMQTIAMTKLFCWLWPYVCAIWGHLKHWFWVC